MGRAVAPYSGRTHVSGAETEQAIWRDRRWQMTHEQTPSGSRIWRCRLNQSGKSVQRQPDYLLNLTSPHNWIIIGTDAPARQQCNGASGYVTARHWFRRVPTRSDTLQRPQQHRRSFSSALVFAFGPLYSDFCLSSQGSNPIACLMKCAHNALRWNSATKHVGIDGSRQTIRPTFTRSTIRTGRRAAESLISLPTACSSS